MVEPKLLNCMPLLEVKKTKVLQIILKKLIVGPLSDQSGPNLNTEKG